MVPPLLLSTGITPCVPANFTTPPPESPTIYSIPGQNASLTAFISDTTMLLYRGLDVDSNNEIDCGVSSNSKCTLDQNTGKLTFINFQTSNASNYTINFASGINPICLYRFTLVEAGKFILLHI